MKLVLSSLLILSVLVIGFTAISAQEDTLIPVWIKTAIGFWINDEISDEEFLKTIEYFVENEIIIIPPQTTNNLELIYNLQILQAEINIKIEQSQKLVKAPEIQVPLIESNSSFSESEFTEEIIQQIEEQWDSSDSNKPNSVVYYLIHNQAGDTLRLTIDNDENSNSQFKYAEIFITNTHGQIIATTHKTSDYIQDDETWWQKAKQNGLFLSEGGYDESAGVYANDIAIKILDDNGSFIGVLKAVINVESITNDFS